MFPWQSGSEGPEETQSIHLNPLSGRWEPDLSRNQRHVNAAIFYNIWHYFQATQDLAFMRDYGAEMMLEIARCWASIARFNPKRDRYEIHGVMGPDEFHEKFPGAEDGGLRNNAYTNVMVAWLCGVARDVLLLLPATRAAALRDRLGLEDEELRTWESMSRRMFVPFHGDGIISQFEGYAELEELDWDAYRAKYGNIQRLDRILRAEGDDPGRYKVAKQADTVMLFFLFSGDELRRLFGRLGYGYGPDTARKNIAYYDRRTSHGSTLSFIAHAGSWRRWTRRAPGSGSSLPWRATSATSRVGPRRRASTWASCPGRSTSSSAATRARISATASCTSTPGSPARSTGCRSRCSFRGLRSW
jgi:trehalose/maltose hydrolase-like predicted phosphorylase